MLRAGGQQPRLESRNVTLEARRLERAELGRDAAEPLQPDLDARASSGEAQGRLDRGAPGATGEVVRAAGQVAELARVPFCGIEVVPLEFDVSERAERQRGMRAPFPAAGVRDLDRAACESLGSSETAADQLEPREAAEACELRVGHIREARRLERLREVALGLAKPIERDLCQAEMRKRDRAHRLRRLRREQTDLRELEQLVREASGLVERAAVRAPEELRERQHRLERRRRRLRPQLQRSGEPPRAAAGLPADEVDARQDRRQLRRGVDVGLRDAREDVAAERGVGPRDELEPAVGEAHGEQVEIAGGERVLHGLHRRTLLEMPLRRAGMQFGDPVAFGVTQLRAEQLGEQVVVAVPGRLRVDPVDEEVVGDEALGDVRTVGAAGHRVGEVGREALGDRRGEEEVPNVLGLPPQHLCEQVLGRRPAVEGERLEHTRIRADAVVREHEQPQPGGPALRPDEQRRERLRVDFEREAVEKLARLVGRERKVARTQLRQFAARAQEVQRQHRVVPRRQHESQRRGRGAQQLVQRRRDLDALDGVEVVDRDDDRLLELREAVEQLQHEAGRRPRAGRRDPAERGPRRHDALDRGQPLRPERRLAEPTPRSEPRDPRRLHGEPRREERRLPEARRRRQQRQRTPGAVIEAV